MTRSYVRSQRGNEGTSEKELEKPGQKTHLGFGNLAKRPSSHSAFSMKVLGFEGEGLVVRKEI